MFLMCISLFCGRLYVLKSFVSCFLHLFAHRHVHTVIHHNYFMQLGFSDGVLHGFCFCIAVCLLNSLLPQFFERKPEDPKS